MQLEKVSDFGDVGSGASKYRYLDVHSLTEGVKDTRLAYVISTNVGLQRNNGAYVTFYLKDCNGTRISARLFNVEDFMFSGIKASEFNHKPVVVTFIPQIFNGTMSLIVDGKSGISVYNGEFDFIRFIGKVDVPTVDISAVADACDFENWTVPSDWYNTSIDSICSGKVGGFAAVVYSALHTIDATSQVMGINSLDGLLQVFYLSMDVYFRFLNQQVKNQITSEVIGIDRNVMIMSYGINKEHKLYLPLCDTINALCGISKPLGLEAHLIKRSVDLATFMLNANESLSLIPFGSKASIGGVDLLKY